MASILLVDDDANIRSIIREYALSEDWQFTETADGQSALRALSEQTFSLVVLDVMMPGIDGWTVLRKLRETSQIPVILLTARDEEYDRLLGFELGVDDYVSKPFSPKELIARMKALLKRSGAVGEPRQVLKFGPLSIDATAKRAVMNDQVLVLTPKEFDLLQFLASKPDRAFTREQLLNQIWGYDYYGDARTVDTHIRSLRDKLGQYRQLIGTVWGTGYRFEAQAWQTLHDSKSEHQTDAS